MWWGEEMWWWIRCPGVSALRTGVELGTRLVAVVERWGVLAHEGVVSVVVVGGGAISSSTPVLLYSTGR